MGFLKAASSVTLFILKINGIADIIPSSFEKSLFIDDSTKSKLGFYVPFNSQGHIGTGPQNCHL